MTPRLLRPSLRREHAQWLQEVRTVLEGARQPTAGIWERWRALNYLQTTFPRRLAQERLMVESVTERLSQEQRVTLWALGELLETLRIQVDHLVGLCHRAGEFGDVSAKICTALDYWCREVDEDLGPLAVTALPAAVRSGVGVDSTPEPAGV